MAPSGMSGMEEAQKRLVETLEKALGDLAQRQARIEEAIVGLRVGMVKIETVLETAHRLETATGKLEGRLRDLELDMSRLKGMSFVLGAVAGAGSTLIVRVLSQWIGGG